jgi:hypothetical protein
MASFTTIPLESGARLGAACQNIVVLSSQILDALSWQLDAPTWQRQGMSSRGECHDINMLRHQLTLCKASTLDETKTAAQQSALEYGPCAVSTRQLIDSAREQKQ